MQSTIFFFLLFIALNIVVCQESKICCFSTAFIISCLGQSLSNLIILQKNKDYFFNV
ncbi:hypothetical protein I3843_12G004200 [Carya illinoinensis]|nr:hypothetical protein I3843_12G004200 [Carya illinoinensis]